MIALSESTEHRDNGDVTSCSSQCDHSGGFAGTRPGTEPFTLPRLPTFGLDVEAMYRADVANAPTTRDAPPEIPPPRSRQS